MLPYSIVKKDEEQRLPALFERFLSGYYDATKTEQPQWLDIVHPSEAHLRSAIETVLAKTPNSKRVLEIASVFYGLVDEPERALPLLTRWAQADKQNVRPLILHAQYFFEERLDYRDFVADVIEALKRTPKSALVLSLAYEGAQEAKDGARQLYYAGELAEATKNPHHLFLFGKELGRNGLLDKAAKVFAAGLKREAKNVRCLNGLAYCHLQRLELDMAEELFKQSLATEATDIATKSLKVIAQLQDGKCWGDLEKRQKKYWQDWSDAELRKLTQEEQKRRVAECLVVGVTQKTT